MITQSFNVSSARSAGLVALFGTLLLILSAGGVLAQGEGETTVKDGLQWALSTNGEDLLWDEAEAYCAALNLAGHDDWRLPTIDELLSQHDASRAGEVKIAAPLPQDHCCLWSATSLDERLPEPGHFYIEERKLEPAGYAWAFLYTEEGIEYYSAKYFPDGEALCVRDV